MAYTLRPSEAEVDVEVRHEDQMKINEFGVLNQEKRELEDAIKSLKVRGVYLTIFPSMCG